MKEQQLQGKVALVTGGGSGLGEAVCRLFSAEGASVVAADIREPQAAAVSRGIAAAGGACDSVVLDVADSAEVEKTVADIIDRYGRLDILINNAGMDVTKPIEELKVEEWDRVVATNLRGPFLLSKAAFPYLGRTDGYIVNIASTASRRTWANASAYHASKWGLLGLSHCLHVEGRKNNVKVCALISGGLRTPFILERFPDVDPNLLQDPKNVARAILFMVTQPEECVIPEMMVMPTRETSWP